MATSTEVVPQRFLELVAHPHRWLLVSELAVSDRRVGELAELSGGSQNLISYHLRQLRDAGLVSSRRSSFDGRDTYYRFDVDRFGALMSATAGALDPGLRVSMVPPAATAQSRRQRRRVLFLCTGNSARSQMAEALLEHASGHTIDARSAGSHPKALHPNAVRAMAARDIDIAGNTTKHLRRFARTRFDAVITLCDKVREVCPEFPGRPTTTHWSMPDPAAEGVADADTYPAFERTAQELEARIRHLIPRLSTIEGEEAHAR